MAPFVVVLGCGGPKTEPTPVPPRPPAFADAGLLDAEVASTSVDAAPSSSLDATGPIACYRGRCNPPPPEAARPSSYSGKVVSMAQRGSTFEVVIVLDRGHRVEKGWLVEFLDDDDHVLPEATGYVSQVGSREVTAMIRGKLLPSKHVRLHVP